MPTREPTSTTNLDIYDDPPLPWSRAHDRLKVDLVEMSTPVFLGTTRPDGRPHSAGIGALWLDDDLYITSGPGTRKSRNLAANPFCTLSMRLQGIDLILEGEAARVTDPETLTNVARAYSEGGWPADVAADALTAPYSAPSAGPPPWHVHRITVHTAFGVATTEPYGATRWRFS